MVKLNYSLEKIRFRAIKIVHWAPSRFTVSDGTSHFRSPTLQAAWKRCVTEAQSFTFFMTLVAKLLQLDQLRIKMRIRQFF